ncbi:FAD-binding protein, partial [Nostoc sp. UIC 10630]|uniref:FAD-binding protein n=1 Tax=Nostoc sp. UIC 10630 TaxID=2100146 RepID=UPI0013CF9AE9
MPCPSSSYTGGQQTNQHWQNYIQSVDITVNRYWTPNSLPELVYIVQRAGAEGRHVRAVGAGYSFEDIAGTSDWMVDLRNLNGFISRLVNDTPGSGALTEQWRMYQFSDSSRKLVHVEAGTRLFDLCQYLTERNLALPTMGGALGQHIAGAFSTSTHGSDVNLPPLCDLVQAVHLVTENGQEIWIEAASQSLTNNDALLREALQACPDLQIMRDNDLLNSVVVSMGRFGIIYAVVLEVTTLLHIAEFAQKMAWTEIANALVQGVGRGSSEVFGALHELLRDPPSDLQILGTALDYRYLELVFSSRNASECWVRRRWVTQNTADYNVEPSSDFLCHRGVGNGVLIAAGAALYGYAGLVAAVPVVGAFKSIEIIARANELTARASDSHLTGGAALAAALNAMWASEFAGIGMSDLINEVVHKAVADTMNIPETVGRRGLNWVISAGIEDPVTIGSCYRGNSIEIIFGLDTRAYIDFINAVLAHASDYRQAGYIAVRFTHRSRALLSMHNVDHEIACSIEITSIRGLSGNDDWMRWIEQTAISMGGRPHWGQQNKLDRNQVEHLYPANQLLRWRTQLQRIVGFSVTFSNNYTTQRGLEPIRHSFAQAAPVTALARFPDGKGLDLWVTGNDGNVYTAYYHDDLGSWKGWYQIAGNVPSGLPAGAPVTALARFPDGKGLDLWVTGNDGNVYTAYYHDDLGSWKGWYQIAGNVPSGLPAGAPVTALARFPDGKGLDLWVTGNDGNVYTAYYHDDLGSWKGWYQIAGNVPSGLPAGAPVTA